MTPFDPADLRAHAADAHASSLAEAERLAKELDAAFAFESVSTTFLLERLGGYQEHAHGIQPATLELAGFLLYPRFGEGGSRTSEALGSFFSVLRSLHFARNMQLMFDSTFHDLESARVSFHTRMSAETVRGSAYPHQIRARIAGIQGPHERWFKHHVGIGPLRVLAVLEACSKAFRARVISLRKSPPPDMAKWSLAVPKEEVITHLADLVEPEWQAFRSLFGMTKEARASMNTPRDVRLRPVYFLPDDRVIMLDFSCVYDAVFDTFDELTRCDEHSQFRDSKYSKGLSRWMENETATILNGLFPADCVYKGLTYPDPNRPKGQAELDVAIRWGPFLLLAEVKGKQFREQARLGDPVSLRRDIAANISDAFSQATRAIAFINSADSVQFKEKNTGRFLVIHRDEIRRIFPVSVTLHEFGSLTTQMAILQGIGLFKDASYPWAVSLSSLGIIAQFADYPDALLHYIQRRLDMQKHRHVAAADELDLFGIYLVNRLDPDLTSERHGDKGEIPDLLMLTGGAEEFDTWFNSPPGKAPRPHLKLPSRARALLGQFRASLEPTPRWMAFAILGLSQEGMATLEGALEKLEQPPDMQTPRVTFTDRDMAVSIIGVNGRPPARLKEMCIRRGFIDKYRSRKSASLVLAVAAAVAGCPVLHAQWIEEPWQPDPMMEEEAVKEALTLAGLRPRPERNAPCFCASGLKFKHCCLPRLATSRRH